MAGITDADDPYDVSLMTAMAGATDSQTVVGIFP